KIHSDTWLREFLKEAHLRKIKVSAWINVFYSWGYAQKTHNLNHLINLQPSWYVQDQFKRSMLDYEIDELQSLGIEGYYLSPANTQVRAYLTNIAEEIMNTYDFDGIHLDYIRYPGKEFIYDVSLRSKFMRRYCIDPDDIFTKSEFKMRYSLWGYDDLKKQWEEFIYKDLTIFVKNLSELLKKNKPEIQISVAVKPNYLNARQEYFQDWMEWVDSGFVDFVCLMAYGKHIDKYLNKILKVVREPYRVTVGLGLYVLSPQQIKRQVTLVKSKPFSGVVFFSYDQLKKNKEYLYSLR
ncbi:family 10 glycosylhydrolase, partial [candidate division WOR-3 bacterium]|nr:family 10 glycosylhydrolase [candidate division WOR-3 bacterium]